MIRIIKMQIGYQFKVDKFKMEYVLIIIMDIQQDNVFKMIQIILLAFGIQILAILVIVDLFLFTYFRFISLFSIKISNQVSKRLQLSKCIVEINSKWGNSNWKMR